MEKLGDIPISGGPGTNKTQSKTGDYQKSKVLKLRIPKKNVDALGIIRYDKDGEKIRVPFFIRPSLKKAIETREFELVYKFNKDILGDIKVDEEEVEVEIEEEDEEEEEESTSEEKEDFGIENIINEEEK